VPFISSGLVVNDKGIIVGEDTVGRELFVLTQAFGGE
jgi:translation initiation factor 6 (eIF-6)